MVDEALSVGDAHFQSKCFARMSEIHAAGGTILFVSHSPEQIAHHCSRAIWLDCGLLAQHGEAMPVLQAYLSSRTSTSECRHVNIEAGSQDFAGHPDYDPLERRWGNGEAVIEAVRLIQSDVVNPTSIASCSPLEISFTIRFSRTIAQPVYGLTIKDIRGTPVFSANSRQLLNIPVGVARAGERIVARFLLHPYLDAGEYRLSFGVVEQTAEGLQALDRRYDAIRMRVTHPSSPDFVTDLHAHLEVVTLS